jgi:hypothetical protein
MRTTIKPLIWAAAALVNLAHAGGIEIGQVRLGMTETEFAKAYPRGVDAGIALAGASTRSAFARPSVQFRDGRLEQFSAYFPVKDFDRIRRAVVARNASVQCAAGEGFAVCNDPEGSFVLSRSGATTMLLLQSMRMAADGEQAVSELPTSEDLGAGM